MTKTRQIGAMHRFLVVALLSSIFSVSLAQGQSRIAVSVVPGAQQIPANTLRLYVEFSESMMRGQVARYIHIEDSNGHAIRNPFLNLGTELWDNDQTRLTLLFDPGRVKLGVGPNARYGPPLNEGESVSLVVSEEMESADGVLLGKTHRTAFDVGAAERRPLAPQSWKLRLPTSNSTDTLEISFGRLMDVPAASRLIRVRTMHGQLVEGEVVCDGRRWSFEPTFPWAKDEYEVVVHTSLEDVSGNTPFMGFDKVIGTSAKQEELISLRFSTQNDKDK